MKRILMIVMAIVGLCVMVNLAHAAEQWGCTALTGGMTGALDAIDITPTSPASPNDVGIADGWTAVVAYMSGTTGIRLSYVFDADATSVESSPGLIRPDDYTTQGVWRLASLMVEQLPALTEGYIFQGNSSNRPVAVNNLNFSALSESLPFDDDGSAFFINWNFALTASRTLYGIDADMRIPAAASINTSGQVVAAGLASDADDGFINLDIDGGGSAITTGIKGSREVPFDCTINSATALADQSGSVVVDIWVDTYANYPPTDADSITASAPVTITSANKSQDLTLTGWTVSLTKGQIISYNVDSAATIERLTISLKVDR